MDNYNVIAENYNASEQDAITLWQLGYPVVIELLGNVSSKTILDYGCGTGTFSRFLHSKDAIVTGVDVSDNMIEVARNNSNNSINYQKISDRLDIFADHTFDLAVANFVLCTIPSRNQIISVLKEIFHVLKKGGTFVIMNSNWDRSNGKDFISFKLNYCENLVSGQPVTAVITSEPPIPLHDFFWPIEDYLEMLKECGFTLQSLRQDLANHDQVTWLDERDFPPYYVISAAKP
jgi:ubiquinone/menaquinone biosynthesis C-methylase UbiE